MRTFAPNSRSFAPTGTRLLLAAAGFSAVCLGTDYLQAQSRLGILRPRQQESAPAQNERDQSASTTRLNFYSKTWDQVLNHLADSTGSVLVADRAPSGRYSRQDFRNYSRSEAVRILNDELEKNDYRLLEKGKYLVLLHLPSARPEYSRLQIGRSEPAAAAGTAAEASGVQQAAVAPQVASQRQSGFRQGSVTIQSGESSFRGDSTGRASLSAPRQFPTNESRFRSETTSKRTTEQQRSRPGAIRQLGYESGPSNPAFPPAEAAPASIVRRTFQPASRSARSLSATLYGAFRERAELVEQGPDGLPAMRVFAAQPGSDGGQPPRVLFTIAADIEQNELLVEGPEDQISVVLRLLQRLDVVPQRAEEATRLIATDKSPNNIAVSLRPAVNRMVAQNDGSTPPPTETDRVDADGNELPDVVGGIRGNVSVEAMDDLGVLILKGNTPDVDAVMEIIKQIEELSARTAPDIHLRLLDHVDSRALAELLTAVYSQLNQARGRTQQQAPQIGVIAVGRPNGVLILAPEADLESINSLIDELDQPVPNQATFVVLTLKHGIASSVADLISEAWNERVGLENQPRVIADARTNSIVAIGTRADLAEITKLVEQLDKQESGAVNEVQVIELRHAVAEELASTINEIVQSVLNPPQLGQGQLGQAFLGFGGNSSQALREVRSAVLEYLVGEGNEVRKVRSGILADIRITPDPRSNAVIVASPRESMELVIALIQRLDRPASSVATIKHFSLKNADAQSTRDLLDELFGNETQGSTDVGVQLAGAEQASSVVPLKFSVDVRTNSIVAVGTAEALQVVEALIFRLDDSDIRQRQTTIIRLKNAPAADIAAAVDNFLASQTDLLQSQDNLISAFEFVEREVIVQAETYTNSLLISATPRYFDQIREMVLTLDQELPQVIIQAMLVEVELQNTDEFGIELGIQDSVLFNRGQSGTAPGTPGFNFNMNGLQNTNAASQGDLVGQAISTFGVGRLSTTQPFGGLVLSAGSESVSLLLRALAQTRNIEILSRPQIRTLDNRPALIRMVREQQIISGFNVNNNTGALNPVLDLDDAGIVLSVTPTISPDGNILMSLTAEKSQFIPNAGAVLSFDDAGNPATRGTAKDLTQAESTVVVSDQQTIVLGGLITRSIDTETRKVPWLGDLPVIGHGFRFDTNTTRRTELLIFLTPRIVHGAADNELIKQIESQRMHYCEADAEEIHGPIYGIPANSMPSTFEMTPMNGSESTQLPIPLPVPGSNDSFPATTQSQSAILNRRRAGSPSRIRQVGYEEPARGPAEKPSDRKQPFLNIGSALRGRD